MKLGGIVRFHFRGVAAFLLFVAVVALGLDMRFGVIAIAAATVLDWLSILLPLGLGQGRDRPQGTCQTP